MNQQSIIRERHQGPGMNKQLLLLLLSHMYKAEAKSGQWLLLYAAVYRMVHCPLMFQGLAKMTLNTDRIASTCIVACLVAWKAL